MWNQHLSECQELKMYFAEKHLRIWSIEGILTVFLKPKYAPIKVRGTEMPNHSARMATSVPKGTAAEEPSTHRIRFVKKKSTNTILQKHSILKLHTGIQHFIPVVGKCIPVCNKDNIQLTQDTKRQWEEHWFSSFHHRKLMKWRKQFIFKLPTGFLKTEHL